LNPRPLGYACHYSFRCLDKPVCGLDFLFTLGPALPPLGCLPLSLYTFFKRVLALKAWLGITPLPASPNLTGDRTEVSFYTAHCRIDCSFRMQSQSAENPSYGIEPNELPDCSTPQGVSIERGGASQIYKKILRRKISIPLVGFCCAMFQRL